MDGKYNREATKILQNRKPSEWGRTPYRIERTKENRHHGEYCTTGSKSPSTEARGGRAECFSSSAPCFLLCRPPRLVVAHGRGSWIDSSGVMWWLVSLGLHTAVPRLVLIGKGICSVVAVRVRDARAPLLPGSRRPGLGRREVISRRGDCGGGAGRR